MRLPTFFSRSPTRLILLNIFLIWLSIRAQNLPVHKFIEWALTIILCVNAEKAKELLEVYAGFPLPGEALYFFPFMIEELLFAYFPVMAIEMGTSPCDDRVARKTKYGACYLGEAHNCYVHAARREKGRNVWDGMEFCYEHYRVSTKEAAGHYRRCHGTDDRLGATMGSVPCALLRNGLDERNGQCTATEGGHVIGCVSRYGNLDEVVRAYARRYPDAVRNVSADGASNITVTFGPLRT